MVSFLNLRSDQFLLGYLAGTASVGVYSVAVTVAELLLFFPRSLATALMPRITGADSVSAKHMAASACRHTVGGALLSAVVLVPIGLLIPVLFGEAYRPSVVPFFLLLPGLGAYALAPVLSTYFSGQLGRPIVTSLFAGMSLALDVTWFGRWCRAWGFPARRWHQPWPILRRSSSWSPISGASPA